MYEVEVFYAEKQGESFHKLKSSVICESYDISDSGNLTMSKAGLNGKQYETIFIKGIEINEVRVLILTR